MMRARKASMALALLVSAGVLLTACGPKNSAPAPQTGGSTTPSQTANKPAVGGELNLRLAKDPDNFNPILSSTSYGSAIYTSVYARLFEFNTKLEPTPYVAESWSASADNLTWTIKIKQGIKFHDGGDLTAEDVVFTLMSIKDKGYTGPRASSLVDVESVTAPDKYTVEIKLKQPFAPLFNNINYGILQKKLFEGSAVADMDKHPVTMNPVGAGPYKFVEYKRGQYVMLERNDNWFMSQEKGGAPFIKTLRYKVIPEDATAQAALENGEIDVETPQPKEVGRLRSDFANKLTAVDYERRGWGYMTLNTERPHLNDKLVRQALTLGMDRQSIIDGVMDGLAVIPAGPIPPVSWAFDSSIKAAPYDPAGAKKLLEQAGYKMGADGIYEKNGEKLKLAFYGSSGSSLIEGIAAITKKNWKDIGVDLDVQLIDFNAMMDNFVKPGKFDISFSGFSLGLDPDQYALFHSTQVAGFNRGRYNNPKVDKLLEDGRRESDPAKRKAIYSEYQKILVDDAPVILIYANKYTDFVSTKVKGGVVNFPGAGAAVDYIYQWYTNVQ